MSSIARGSEADSFPEIRASPRFHSAQNDDKLISVSQPLNYGADFHALYMASSRLWVWPS